MEPPRDDANGGDHFAYFMVRIRVQAPGEPANVAGVVERLGTGRKHSFPDGKELLRVLADWSRATAKMGDGGERRNEHETSARGGIE